MFAARLPRLYSRVSPAALADRARERARVTGRVSSARGDKTVSVVRRFRVWNERYGVTATRTRRLSAHDAENACEPGDTVVLRPLGRRRGGTRGVTWEVDAILRRDPGMRFAERLAVALPGSGGGVR